MRRHIWLTLALILALALPLPVAADDPSEPAEHGPASRPPAPWLEDQMLLQWALDARVAGVTRHSSPDQVRALIAMQGLQPPRLNRGEYGGPNPRAYKRLMENEKMAQAAGQSPRALGLGLTGTAKLLIIPVEFAGTQVFDSGTITITGPLHNEIPDPAGTGDNHSFWLPDFNASVYDHLFFDTGPTGGITTPVRTDLNGGAGIDLTGLTAANYYLEQSGGVYSLDGYVTPWMSLPVSEGEFGANDPAGYGDDLNGPVWRVVISATNALNAYWQTTHGTSFPWDEYDTDGNGIVDHLMLIHAGIDESGGGGAQGEYAIWAHSWNVDGNKGYVVDPANNIKVLNYTIVPENTDIGVYCHEFGHDIGLPDLYDTSYATGNSTAFWDLMSSGSWLGPVDGMQPAPINLWGRYVLGWADPVVLDTNSDETELTLGQLSIPPEDTEDGVIVNLPSRYAVETAPHSGQAVWWSSNDRNMADSGLVRTLSLGASTPISFTMWTDYVIEEDWDFAFVEVSTDSGATWTQIPGFDATTGMTVTTPITYTDPNNRLHDMCAWRGGAAGCTLQHGLTGGSGGWVHLRFDLSPYAGQTIQLRLTYATDEGYLERGMYVDDLSLDTPAGNVFSDDVEAGMNGWVKDNATFDTAAPGSGWVIGNGKIVYPHYYIAEWRNRSGFDRGMQYVYNYIRDAETVERVPYDLPGMLLWYRDYRYSDNAPYYYLFDSPSWGDKGMLLVVDAHPAPYRWDPKSATSPFSNLSYRMQAKDAAFGLGDTAAFTLTNYYSATVTQVFPSRPAESQFHDSQGYYAGLEWYGPDPDDDYWQSLGSSVVVPAAGDYWARWLNPGFYDLGNPGLLNLGVHMAVEEQAADGSWGKVRIWNDHDTFVSRKEVSDPDPAPGDTITYTIVLKDAAGSDGWSRHLTYAADLEDFIPEGSTYVPGSLALSGNGTARFDAPTGVITWTGTLGGHELAVPDAVLSFAVVADEGRSCNTAMVFVGTPDEYYLPMHSAYTLRTWSCGAASVVGTKTVDKTGAQRGAELLYTIVLTNTGEAAAEVVLSDHTPNWTQIVPGSLTGGALFIKDNPHELTSGNVTWSGWIPASGTMTFTYKVTVLNSAPFGVYINNVAQIETIEGLSELVASTLVEPFRIYMPIIMRDFLLP